MMPTDPRDLVDACADLDHVAIEAAEEGHVVPSDQAQSNARRLLYAMYRIAPQRFEVYPMPHGEVAIDACAVPGSSVIVLCGSDGGAVCLTHVQGAQQRRSYRHADMLPDEFLRSSLERLA